MQNQIKFPVFSLTILRILIGWHFLYEGIVKISHPEWSSASYLMESKGLFSGIFRTMASDSTMLPAIDILNVLGLTIIGLCLFLGLFTRIAAWAGAFLIFLYYLAQPPFIGLTASGNMEGNYLWVNKNLIEMFSLILLANVPKQFMLGIENLFKKKSEIPLDNKSPKKGSVEVPENDNPEFSSLPILDRRRVLKNLITLPFMGGFIYAVLKNFGYESYEEKDLKMNAYALASPSSIKINALSSATISYKNYANLSDLKQQVPQGKIRDVEISRLILGGNLIVGYAHARDLVYVSELVRNYNTQEKLWETFRLCEACGINAILARTAPDVVHPLNKYWKQGGKIKWIASTYPREEDLFTNTQLAIDLGAPVILFYGGTADTWVMQNRFDLFDKWFSHFQGKGIPLGVGAHELQVIKAMEEKGYPTDYYFKTIHENNYWSYQPDEPKDIGIIGSRNDKDNHWCVNPEETALFMETVNKPWIGFKVLAAGAIKPEKGLRYAFEKGVDFACVGMFDYQVVRDCNILSDTLEKLSERKRRFF